MKLLLLLLLLLLLIMSDIPIAQIINSDGEVKIDKNYITNVVITKIYDELKDEIRNEEMRLLEERNKEITKLEMKRIKEVIEHEKSLNNLILENKNKEWAYNNPEVDKYIFNKKQMEKDREHRRMIEQQNEEHKRNLEDKKLKTELENINKENNLKLEKINKENKLIQLNINKEIYQIETLGYFLIGGGISIVIFSNILKYGIRSFI